MNTYIDNQSDWVLVETVISTDPDQIAVAPGSLLEEYEEEGRRYFHYLLDHRSLNFYSFISARYEVHREKYKGVDVEVYYDDRHPYNVDKMANSIKKSLEYYTTNFGPYYHKQARIIEFPRYATFAQAFPGTMPYSEGIGFIAKIEDEEDIDMVFYVVAHEMAHQYWAHQVIGAAMQGATLLSETFAQYSALMVMEKEYGRDQMKRFLKYEMNRYLRSRGTEELKEVPLMYVENQGYIHYRKGSLVMYYLREMIGEENVNAALRKLIADHGYKEPPYPTSHAAVDAFTEHTPDSLQYIITDLFREITLFSNRTTDVTSKELAGGRYEVTVDYESHKYRADSLGKETEIDVNDWIEIGVYADPGDKDRLGKKLYSGLHRISNNEGSIKVLVAEKPYQAGIDPRNLLVDLVGDDNVKKVAD
jgi:aminopeptidase N